MQIATQIVGSLLALEADDDKADIRLYINSSGAQQKLGDLWWEASAPPLHAFSSTLTPRERSRRRGCARVKETSANAETPVHPRTTSLHACRRSAILYVCWRGPCDTGMRPPITFAPSLCIQIHAGGQPYSIFGILDTIKIIKPDVQTYSLGACYSYASLILVRAACTGHTVEWVWGELLSKFGWQSGMIPLPCLCTTCA